MTSRDEPADALRELLHDHGELGRLVLAVSAALLRIESGETDSEGAVTELGDGVESLRDALFVHFARESEILFPFVESHLPAFSSRVALLREEHDIVCARVMELARAVTQASRDGVGFITCTSRFESFGELYAQHAQGEQAFLREVDAALDPSDRTALRDLLEAI